LKNDVTIISDMVDSMYGRAAETRYGPHQYLAMTDSGPPVNMGEYTKASGALSLTIFGGAMRGSVSGKRQYV